MNEILKSYPVRYCASFPHFFPKARIVFLFFNSIVFSQENSSWPHWSLVPLVAKFLDSFRSVFLFFITPTNRIFFSYALDIVGGGEGDGQCKT